MNEKWYKDLMVQKYQLDVFFDPTKLFFIMSLAVDGHLKGIYSLEEISTNVYRFYCANKELCNHNVNIIIRNLSKYGVSDIMPIVSASIRQFIKEQINKSIDFNEEFVALKLDDYSDKSASTTLALCNTLFQKYFKIMPKAFKKLDYVKDLDDENIFEFGKCFLRERVLEDYQYCPICEKTDIENLYIVHILKKNEGALPDELIDKNNCLLMCREECVDYIKGKFYIDEFGKIINVNSGLIEPGMRISLRILNSERRKYLKRKINFMKGIN